MNDSAKYNSFFIVTRSMKKACILILLTTFLLDSKAIDFELMEDSLAAEHQLMKKDLSDEQRDSISSVMHRQFISLFSSPETFDYAFSDLKFCVATSKDHHIRLFNWNIPHNDGTHRYVCFVLVWDKKEKNYWWTELTEPKNESEKIENKFLNADKWLGALYYEIIPMEKKKTDTYTLLGWDGKDNLTQRKIVDALTITGKKIRMGASIFKSDEGTRKRLIYEYSDEVSSSVKFYQKKKCVVVDHLSPKNPNMVGIYADYGPDGSYDVLTLVKGKWELLENIDISQFATDDGKPFIDPRKK